MNDSHVVTFGCRLNAFESEEIQKILDKLGISNHIVINSCAVTSEAERQVKQKIRQLSRNGHSVIITGCAGTYAAEEYAKLPGVVGVISNEHKLTAEAYIPFSQNKIPPANQQKKHKDKVRYYLPIQTGCDHKCTYCIVQHTRGKSVSFPKESIAQHAMKILSEKTLENIDIVLTGVNISSYYSDNCKNLSDLIKYLLKTIPELSRLRLSSVDPADVDDELINLLTSESRIMPHLHLSIQSGDDTILKRMLRRHTAIDVIKANSKILSKRNDFIFGGDFITGFPTEDEKMFTNTLSFLKEAHISLGHIFPYSERPGTPASLMPQVLKHIRKERTKILIEESKRLLNIKLNEMLDKEITVLAETEFIGKTDNFLSVVSKTPMVIGKLYNKKTNDILKDKLVI